MGGGGVAGRPLDARLSLFTANVLTLFTRKATNFLPGSDISCQPAVTNMQKKKKSGDERESAAGEQTVQKI